MENHRKGAKNAKIFQRALFIPSVRLDRAMDDFCDQHVPRPRHHGTLKEHEEAREASVLFEG
ncbi:MAG: hypothetical protein D6723_08720 [Acidobacteria bacterium]|nr:MAG: hypothetical protein D6723_08720 [Acidobacteriota bacterium]